jgi:hypothetical protein
MEGLEVAMNSLIKELNPGLTAILAPYLGGIFIGIPLSIFLAVFLFLVAFTIGAYAAMALAGIVLAAGLTAYSAGEVFSMLLFKPASVFDISDIVLDAAAVIIFPVVAPALYAAGYAGLLSRRHRVTSLYLIALGVIGMAWGITTWL